MHLRQISGNTRTNICNKLDLTKLFELLVPFRDGHHCSYLLTTNRVRAINLNFLDWHTFHQIYDSFKLYLESLISMIQSPVCSILVAVPKKENHYQFEI